jgi:hypothetical protein
MSRDPSEYCGTQLDVDGESQYVPELSTWRHVCSCCGGRCNIAHFPKIGKYFVNQWECMPRYPTMVIAGLCLSFSCAIWSSISLHSGTRRACLIAFTLFTFCIWLISYLCAVFSSPGYVPFYWAVERGERFTYAQQMSGVITSAEQYNFASYNGRPERASLSRQARRIVLRADHICPWIANWVGLKNYRWFFLKLVWAFLYFVDWFVVFSLDSVEMAREWSVSPSYIAMLVCALPVFGFSGFIVVMLRRHLLYSTTNTTTLQEFKKKKLKDKHNYYNLGCWRNYVAIMGPAKCCICWFFPVPIQREWGGFKWELNRDKPADADLEEE